MLLAVTSMPLGRPVVPEVKMMYWVSSPLTNCSRGRGAQASPAAGPAERSAAASITRPGGSTSCSVSGTSQVASIVAPSICPAMSDTRRAGSSASTGTYACPLIRQPRNEATVSADFGPSTSTGPRPETFSESPRATPQAARHSSPYVVSPSVAEKNAGESGDSFAWRPTAPSSTFVSSSKRYAPINSHSHALIFSVSGGTGANATEAANAIKLSERSSQGRSALRNGHVWAPWTPPR